MYKFQTLLFSSEDVFGVYNSFIEDKIVISFENNFNIRGPLYLIHLGLISLVTQCYEINCLNVFLKMIIIINKSNSKM